MKSYSIVLLLIPFLTEISTAQWIQANGAGLGRPTCVAINGTNLFAGTEFGGVIRSSDNGITWNITNNLPIYSLISHGENLYAGTNNCVLWSTDNGLSWTEISKGLPESRITGLAVLDQYVFASTPNSGVFRTTVNGLSWHSVVPDSTYFFIKALHTVGSYVFICIRDSIFRSSDYGVHWFSIAHLDVSCFANNSSTLYAGSIRGIYSSTDYGLNWDTVTTNLSNSTITSITANDSVIIAGTNGQGLFRSTDQGNTWDTIYINSNYSSINITSSIINNTSLLVGTDYGVFFSSDNGTTWSKGNANLGNKFVWSLVSTENNLFAAVNGGVYKSTDLGNNWSCVLAKGEKLIGDRYTNLFANDIYIYAINNRGEMYRTNDQGSTWTYLQNRWTKYTSFAISEGTIFAGTEFDGVVKSINNGLDWVQVNSGLSNLKVAALCAVGSRLFVLTEQGIFQSGDKGAHWEPFTIFFNMQISIFEAFDNFIFIGNSNDSLFFSTDTGKHWIRITTGLPNLKIDDFAAFGTNVFIAPYYNGVFLSTDCCSSWSPVNDGLTTNNIWSLFIHENHLFAGSGGNGLYRRPLSEMITGVEQIEDHIPTKFQLFQNFPNPFNPSTIINYELSRHSFVTLKVFDILGRQVQVLVNQQQNAGKYSITFNAFNLPSGVYFYRLQSDSFVETKKFILLR